MTDNTQPEALRLADWLQAAVQIFPQRSVDDPGGYASEVDQVMDEAAAELRRQHARIAELEAQLASIRADGVSGPLMGQPQAVPDLSALTERGAKAWTAVDAQALRDGGAAPSANAGEPVATVFTMEALAPGGGVKYHATIHKALPAGTKLYTHPSPPEGMAVTDAMIDAGKKMLHNSNGRSAREKVERIFNAMIAAAPPTTPAGSGKGE